MKLSTKNIITYSLFAALTAVFSQISIPLQFTPVPINLATLSVLMSGALLGSRGGALSQIVYVLLGTIGIPVFAQLTGGIGILLGPTGGYIIGYILAAFVTGIIVEKTKHNIFFYLIAMTIGIITCYTVGTMWFMFITKTDLIKSLSMCVIPFIIGDVLKIFTASFLTLRLFPVINKK